MLVGVLAFAHAVDAFAGTASVSGSQLRYLAGAGQSNDVGIAYSSPGVYALLDNSGVTPGPGCTASSSTAVVCTLGAGTPSIAVDLGDGSDDIVVTGPTPASILGGPGNDEIIGGEGSDRLFGAAGADSLTGNGGDDTMMGGPGTDSFDGGGGTDTTSYADHLVPVTVTLDGNANDGAAGENEDVTTEKVLGGSAADSLTGKVATSGNPEAVLAASLDGGPGNDTIVGDRCAFTDENDICNINDVLSGGPGADTIHGSTCGTVGSCFNPWSVKIYGGDGNDAIDGVGQSFAEVYGDAGNDTFSFGPAPDTFHGGSGFDTVSYAARTAPVTATIGGSGGSAPYENDSIGADIESLRGGSGNDNLFGDGNANLLVGNGGSDTLHGGSGNDWLEGGPGNDNFSGDDGADLLIAGPGADNLHGGDGFDTATYAARTSTVSVTLDETANDGAVGEGDNVRADVERVAGGSGDDTFIGDIGPNWFVGNGGGDTLVGGYGNDTLDGGAGTNTLEGGYGNDLFVSGPGADDVIGGFGFDRVSYASRTTGVVVTIGSGGANDGAPGEGDNVRGDVEEADGGAGGDTLTGNGGNNTLLGNGGNDTINGLGGGDILSGGAGSDSITSKDSPAVKDSVACGTSADVVAADVFDSVAVDCETVTRT
jgi:Ca2+-binding RTX toxin-like protein